MDKPTEVTQADRDAAMAMLNHAFRNAPDDCSDGVDLDDIAQAFARHRIAALAAHETAPDDGRPDR